VDLVTDIGAAPARGAATRVAVAVATEMPDIEMTAAAAAAAATTDPSSIFSDRAALVRNIYESKSVAAASDDSWEGAFRTHLASAAYALLFARIIHVLEERMNSEKWEDALAFGRTLSPNVSLAELVAVAVAVHHAFPPVIAQKWFDVYRNTLLSRADHATVLLAVDAAWAQAVCLPVQAGSVARTVVASESVANGMSRTAYDDGGESRDFEGRGPETARMACAVLYVLLGSRAHFGSASDKKSAGQGAAERGRERNGIHAVRLLEWHQAAAVGPLRAHRRREQCDAAFAPTDVCRRRTVHAPRGPNGDSPPRISWYERVRTGCGTR
jgi:hypothetical protein